MYLDWETYAAMGGSAYGEDSYDDAEAWAECILDDVTLGRLKALDWADWQDAVERAMLVAIESLPALQSAYRASIEGTRLSSFNNGVDSLSFATGDAGEDEALAALIAKLQAILPVELTSRCVGGAHVR